MLRMWGIRTDERSQKAWSGITSSWLITFKDFLRVFITVIRARMLGGSPLKDSINAPRAQARETPIASSGSPEIAHEAHL